MAQELSFNVFFPAKDPHFNAVERFLSPPSNLCFNSSRRLSELVKPHLLTSG